MIYKYVCVYVLELKGGLAYYSLFFPEILELLSDRRKE
jgi:hypothetical protein